MKDKQKSPNQLTRMIPIKEEGVDFQAEPATCNSTIEQVAELLN
jgi:hypothetical protein